MQRTAPIWCALRAAARAVAEPRPGGAILRTAARHQPVLACSQPWSSGSCHLSTSAVSNAKGETDTTVDDASDKEADASDPDGDEVAPSVEELIAQLSEKDAEIAGFKDKYMRSIADMQNLRHQTERQVSQAKDFGIQKFAKSLVDVADTLELAIQNPPKAMEGNAELTLMYEGLEGMNKMLIKALDGNGMVQSRPEGEEFDPNIMNAQFEVDGEPEQVGTVAMVTRTGYILNGRPIRPANVGVFRKA